MDVYIVVEKTDIIFHISTGYNIWYLEMFDNFKPIIKKSQISEEKAKKAIHGNRIIDGDELEVIKAKLCLTAP